MKKKKIVKGGARVRVTVTQEMMDSDDWDGHGFDLGPGSYVGTVERPIEMCNPLDHEPAWEVTLDSFDAGMVFYESELETL